MAGGVSDGGGPPGDGDEQADQDEAAGVRAEEAEDPAGIHVGVVRADVGEWGHTVS